MLSIFKEIVDDVNKRYEYRTDMELYGVEERWTDLKELDGMLVGDCEDYCITIANRSFEQGIPLGDLKLHLVATSKKPDHIVLEYKGWYADCNLRRLSRTIPYRKISHRSLDKSDWVRS